jgi:hypothetical protein
MVNTTHCVHHKDGMMLLQLGIHVGIRDRGKLFEAMKTSDEIVQEPRGKEACLSQLFRDYLQTCPRPTSDSPAILFIKTAVGKKVA